MTSPVMPNVRALHLLPHQGVGGVQRFVIEFVRHERMENAQDEIILTQRPLDVDADFLAPATPVHFLGLTDRKLGERAQRLLDLAESRQTRILHAYTVEGLILASEAASRAGSEGARPRVFASMFEAPPEYAPMKGIFDARRLKSAIKSVDGFFVASDALVEPWRAAGAKAEALPAAVDTQRFHPQDVQSSWRSARLPDPRTLLVGSLMRADETKGARVLIDAATRRHKAGRPTALMLVGDGPLYAQLRDEAKESDVLFVRRRVMDGPGFFGRVDAFALHCADELVPVSLVESLSCGRAATVADATGAVAEFVGRDAALMTPYGDVDAVVGAFDRLDDAKFRAELGEAGRKRVLSRHNLGTHRAMVRRAYGEIVASGS